MPNWGNYAQSTNSSGEVIYQWWGFLRCHGDDTASGKDLQYYPAEENATAKNNYCYKTSGNNFKTSFTDMKNGGTYYKNVANPTNGSTDPFTTKDIATPSFVLSSSYEKYIGAKR